MLKNSGDQTDMTAIRHGRYDYTCDGTVVATETWSIETDAKGTQTISSVRDASKYGAHFTIRAVVAAGGNGDYRLVFRAAPDAPVLKSMCYRQRGPVIRARAAGQNSVVIGDVDNLVFFPLMRIFTGKAVLETLHCGGSATWVVPTISLLGEMDDMFALELSVRAVRADSKIKGGHLLLGGPYAAPARIKLRPDGMLESYCFTPQGSDSVWECRYVASGASDASDASDA